MKLWNRLDGIYADARLNPSEKLVAGYLAFRVREESMACRLGAGTIARDTGLDRRTVQRIIERLEAHHVVRVERSGKFKGRNAANIYHLRIAAPRRHSSDESGRTSDTEIAVPRRYSSGVNSGTSDTGIAAPVHGNSGTTPHEPILTVMNRGARASRSPVGGPARARKVGPSDNESAAEKRVRQLYEMAPVLKVSPEQGEPEAMFLVRVEEANERRIAKIRGM